MTPSSTHLFGWLESPYELAKRRPVGDLLCERPVECGTSRGVVQREEPAAGPGAGAAGVPGEGEAVGFYGGQRRERDRPERDHEARPGERDGRREVGSAGADLGRARPTVPTTRIEREAEDGVGDGCTFPAEAGRGKQALESGAGGIAKEGHAGPGSAEPARGLADEQQRTRPGRERHDSRTRDHSRAGAAGRGGATKVVRGVEGG